MESRSGDPLVGLRKGMKTTLLRRLQKLEARTETETLPFVRYGWVKMLPQEFSGERHVVIVKREPTGSARAQWCEFEERAGPAHRKMTVPCLWPERANHTGDRRSGKGRA